MGNLKKPSVLEVDKDTQVTCIDLPGEPIRCVRTKPKLRVVLRKHRDVVFDIKLGSGASYTVESEKSHFYSERDGHLVMPHTPIQFQDGERLHLWVARTFAGKLLLKKNGKLIAAYEPNKIDPFTCTAQNPEGKPAPLIVSIQMASGMNTATSSQRSVSQELLEDMQTMHVMEVKNQGMQTPKEILDFFASGGEETAIDTNSVVTRNWLLGQLVGAGVYGLENQKWIRELNGQRFYLKKRIRKSGEAVYDVIFTGNHKIRELLKGTRYLADNPVVLTITNGAGTANGIRHAAWNATKSTFKKLGAVGIVFSIFTDVAEWIGDYDQIDPATGKPKSSVLDLMSRVGVNLVKVGIVAALTAVAMAGFTLVFGLVATAAIPISVIVVGTIIITAMVTYGIDWLDKELESSSAIKSAISNAATYLTKKHPSDYDGYSALTQSDFGWGVAP
ncbi:hypothetical protein [Limnobacter sp.]|uniref:hypothetical protein n=1 Tax=Limnobacter sp. TaxID=2003368 RepID=UPI002737574C|nr:hypothetical protein [Limnobacter sp.]MDP3188968.1 hypothetical protein [Limnobacter sp.]